jgi:cytochrome c oxidase assembly protein subunit 15
MNTAYTPAENNNDMRYNRQIAIWLLVCCAMVFFMVVLGGVTRLTGSGLSMVQWNPIFGAVPPLDQPAWEEVFDLYKQSPEYQKINIGMDLAGFKQIYWFEFAHRLLGRSIGMVFLIPFLFFLIKGRLHRPLVPRMVALFVLGGLQGLLGWYMVKSGLVDNPHVSQYRLTAHLALAIVIYAYMFWIALGLLPEKHRNNAAAGPPGLRLFAGLLGALLFITALSGGFVAGLKAGHAYNTFPLMDGRWIPEAIFMQEPLWRNFFENIATVQFDHRVLAIMSFIGVVSLWLYGRRQAPTRQARTGLHLLLLVVMLQVALGISTLLLHVPTALAATHQGGALLLLTLILFVNQRLLNRAG